jgi:hypothetical protein
MDNKRPKKVLTKQEESEASLNKYYYAVVPEGKDSFLVAVYARTEDAAKTILVSEFNSLELKGIKKLEYKGELIQGAGMVYRKNLK